MPIKNMNNSFRNKEGVYYKSIGDFCDSKTNDKESKLEVNKYKDTGLKAFREFHKDGYFRVFVETYKGGKDAK